MNHIYTEQRPASLFDPYPIDLLIRTETIQKDLHSLLKTYPRMSEWLKPKRNDSSGARRSHARTPFACKVPNANSGDDLAHVQWKNATGFNRGMFRDALDSSPELMSQVCAIFIQDFICFGYELPQPCHFPGYREASGNDLGLHRLHSQSKTAYLPMQNLLKIFESTSSATCSRGTQHSARTTRRICLGRDLLG
eukprot:scaffold3455_cov213-Prasinococcus_capsulatus_cf.AAC.5